MHTKRETELNPGLSPMYNAGWRLWDYKPGTGKGQWVVVWLWCCGAVVLGVTTEAWPACWQPPVVRAGRIKNVGIFGWTPYRLQLKFTNWHNVASLLFSLLLLLLFLLFIACHQHRYIVMAIAVGVRVVAYPRPSLTPFCCLCVVS